MKAIVFAGHALGAAGIRALIRHGFEVLKVCAGPENMDEAVWFGPVGDLCAEESIPISVEAEVNSGALAAEISGLSPKIAFSFSFPQILGPELLSIPEHGVLGLHESLLPKYRGRFPVVRAMMRDERKTGVTLYYLADEPFTGDVVGGAETAIGKKDTSRTLHDKLAGLAGELLDKTLPLIKAGKAPRTPMEHSTGAGFGELVPREASIDWNKRSWETYNLIRALTRPYSGAFAYFMGEKMTIWRAEPDDTNTGLLYQREIEVEEDRVMVGTRMGALRLDEIEWKATVLEGREIARALEPHWREKFE